MRKRVSRTLRPARRRAPVCRGQGQTAATGPDVGTRCGRLLRRTAGPGVSARYAVVVDHDSRPGSQPSALRPGFANG
jgi:hypothetical protein